jgi:hypothetical protein
MRPRYWAMAVVIAFVAAGCSQNQAISKPTREATATPVTASPTATPTLDWDAVLEFLKDQQTRDVKLCTQYVKTMVEATKAWSLHDLSRARNHYKSLKCELAGYPLAYSAASLGD